MVLHGWNSDNSITWVIHIYPKEIEKILDNRYNLDNIKGAYVEG